MAGGEPGTQPPAKGASALTVTTWPAAPVTDPGLPFPVRKRLARSPQPPLTARAFRRRTLCVIGTGAALWVSALTGDGFWLALTSILMILQLIRPAPKLFSSWYRSRHRAALIAPESLDRDDRQLLARAQRAAADVTCSRLYRDAQIDTAAARTILDAHLWDIARLLRDASELRRQRAWIITAGHAPDPAVQEVLDAQAEALARVVAAVSDRVDELEDYAAAVREADGQYRAWRCATAAASLNASVLDLLARAPGHAQTSGEVDQLAGDARTARDRYRDLLADPAAAPPLVLTKPSRRFTAA